MCCKKQNILLVPEPVPKRNASQQQCGRRNVAGLGLRLTGSGGETLYGEIPWMVAVLGPGKTRSLQGDTANVYLRGGSLIHPQVVLTVANGVQEGVGLVIRAGEWDTQTTGERFRTQDRNVKEVIVHEQFSSRDLHNDIALLVLESPVDMSVDNVGTICLLERNETFSDQNCVTTGWGRDLFGAEGKYSVILKKTELAVMPRDACQEALRKTRLGARFQLHNSFMCAKDTLGSDACKGDGGAALACPTTRDPNVYVQAGIIDWLVGCKTPWATVDVSMFVEWIHLILKERDILYH